MEAVMIGVTDSGEMKLLSDLYPSRSYCTSSAVKMAGDIRIGDNLKNIKDIKVIGPEGVYASIGV